MLFEQFDDAALDRMSKDLIHPIPGDSSFLAAASAVLRAILAEAAGKRRLAHEQSSPEQQQKDVHVRPNDQPDAESKPAARTAAHR